MKQKKSVTEGNLFPELEEKKVETPRISQKKAQATEKKELQQRIKALEAENKQLRHNLDTCEAGKQKLVIRLKGLELDKQSFFERIQTLEADNKKLKIKADLFDELISSNSLFPTTIVAKSFGWSAIKLNKYLHEKGVQFKQGKVWVLYAKFADQDYTKICWYDYAHNEDGSPRTRAHSYWTAKGIQFIRELLIDDGKLAE